MEEQNLVVVDSEQMTSLSRIPHRQRMLLLPHCLRPSEGCPGKTTKEGLQCDGCMHQTCKILPIRQAAQAKGYAVCVAPGGRMAVRQVAAVQPKAIIAVACDKELRDGVAAVQALELASGTPLIVQVPLLRDGCADTDVDLERVLKAIAL